MIRQFPLRLLLFLFLCRLSFGLSAQTTRIHPSCPFHLIIALDFSGSEREYLSEIQTALHALTSNFELHEHHLKVGIITFNRGAKVVLPLTGETEKMDSVIQALRISRIVYATDIHSGIELAEQEFRRYSESNIPKYFVLISDGDPHAHRRGFGFQQDLINMTRIKTGNREQKIDPVHVFSLYTGRLSPFRNQFSEDIRKASIEHMQALASDKESFFFYEQYPMLVDFFARIANCQ